mgnify:CR=1 FL=1
MLKKQEKGFLLMMVHRRKVYFLMSYGVRRNDKQRTYSFYLFLVCVKDVYVSPTQAVEHKLNPNKKNHKLTKLPYLNLF